MYDNGYAEALRSKFVKHPSKKLLEVPLTGTTVFQMKMLREEIQENMIDDGFCDWFMPQFSTTTLQDQTVASIVLMSSMQKYFGFILRSCCGIPQVKLLGTVEDWQSLRAKIDRLLQYNIPNKQVEQKTECDVMDRWHTLLKYVLDEFVLSKKGQVNIDFWDKVCSRHPVGSGSQYLSGWITVFCFFNCHGKEIPTIKSGEYLRGWNRGEEAKELLIERNYFYPMIDTTEIPAGVVSVLIDIVRGDNIQHTLMTAGHFAFTIENKNTIRPSIDWILSES